MKRKKGYYSISVVAKMFGVHQQTIRLYEKEGLISPKRSSGNTRLFSEEDVDRLEEIIYLTNKMGVNIAGVEMILKLQKKVKKLKKEISGLFDKLNHTLEDEGQVLKDDAKKQAQRLVDMKHENKKTIEVSSDNLMPSKVEEKHELVEDWEVDYEE